MKYDVSEGDDGIHALLTNGASAAAMTSNGRIPYDLLPTTALGQSCKTGRTMDANLIIMLKGAGEV